MNSLRVCFRAIVANREIRSSINNEVLGRRYIKRWVSPTQKEITRRKKKLPPQPEPIRSNFLEWNRDAEIFAFNARLSEKFTPEALDQAFTHKSYIQKEERKQREMGITDASLNIQDNEMFIRKGEELTCEVTDKYLSESLPNVPDSVIGALQNYLLSDKMLATACLHLGAKDIILTEEHPVSEKTLALTFLALVGALADSTNPNHAAIFIRDFLIVALAEKDLTEIWCPDKPLDMLNNVLSKENKPPFEPRLIAQAGRNTLLASYHVAVYSNKEFLGSGVGQNIEEAKHIAALNALCRKFGLLDSASPIKFNKEVQVS